MEIVVLLMFVALVVALTLRGIEGRRVAVRAPARINQPRMTRRR
jgi:hypothetical protein